MPVPMSAISSSGVTLPAARWRLLALTPDAPPPRLAWPVGSRPSCFAEAVSSSQPVILPPVTMSRAAVGRPSPSKARLRSPRGRCGSSRTTMLLSNSARSSLPSRKLVPRAIAGPAIALSKWPTMLAPMREREILYRLLQGPLGHQLCAIAQEDSRLSRVRRAILWMHEHFDKMLPTATLAEIAGMSTASFHRHFKAATAMSPLQFQKTLRLHAARRLLAGGSEASRAAYSVGYESASQFSREYARAFGLPPSRDAERLRGMAPMGVATV
ncbi:MAG: helix-turn-helix domain-containing protein [Sphingopyxis sp.]|nr:helix-turn-helix domain-containing protein [Sphingopyxis sp.]